MHRARPALFHALVGVSDDELSFVLAIRYARQRNISEYFSLSRAAREPGRISLTIIEDTRLFSYETLLRFEHWFVSTRLGPNQSLWPPFRQPTLKQSDQSLRAYGLVNAVLSFGAAASRQV